jgi:cytochrome b561/polyisoprenoid-binding protein YceI
MGMADVNLQAAQQRYSSVAVLLHWTIALALAGQIALGFAMPKGPIADFGLFQLHKSIGITILLLSLLRLAWRWTHRPPQAVEGGFNGFLAKTVHTLLYVFMIGAPLTGWAIVSTSRIEVPTMYWGVIRWPHLPLPGSMNEAFAETHEILAFTALALILLHVLGALRHQLFLKDGLLRRMAPGGQPWLGFALLALVLVTYFGVGMYVAGQYLVPAMGRQNGAAATGRVPLNAEPTAAPTAEATEAAEDEEADADEPGEPPVWAIQPGGRLSFAVVGGGDTYRGSFSDWSGNIKFDPEHPESADLRITVRLASASLGDSTMDETLKGGDFFNTSATPTATWRSTSVRQTGPNRYTANGTLSLRGVSKPQTVNFTLSGTGLRRHVEGSAGIDRNAFGVGVGDSAAGLDASVALTFAFDATGREP